jgi:hypothetical protein
MGAEAVVEAQHRWSVNGQLVSHGSSTQLDSPGTSWYYIPNDRNGTSPGTQRQQEPTSSALARRVGLYLASGPGFLAGLPSVGAGFLFGGMSVDRLLVASVVVVGPLQPTQCWAAGDC